MTLEEAVRERLTAMEDTLAKGKETESGYPVPDWLWSSWVGQTVALKDVLTQAGLYTEEDRKRWG